MSDATNKTKILLIEDITGDAQAIIRSISYGDINQHYEIIRVSRLREAMGVLEEEQIQVVLLDLSLPDAKDIKALVEIKVLFPMVPVIVISDQSDDRVIQRAKLNGASEFLSKSETSGVLIRKTIDRVISEKISELIDA